MKKELKCTYLFSDGHAVQVFTKRDPDAGEIDFAGNPAPNLRTPNMKLHHEKIPSDFSIAVRWTGILATLLATLVGLAEIAVRIN